MSSAGGSESNDIEKHPEGKKIEEWNIIGQ